MLDKEDDITKEIENRATVYRRVAHLRSEDIARQISEDGIDILIDLAGHTMGNRIEILSGLSSGEEILIPPVKED